MFVSLTHSVNNHQWVGDIRGDIYRSGCTQGPCSSHLDVRTTLACGSLALPVSKCATALVPHRFPILALSRRRIQLVWKNSSGYTDVT